MIAVGMKISVKDISVLTADKKKLVLSSNQDIIKIVSEGSGTFRHGLDYKPFALPNGYTNNFEVIGSANQKNYALSQQGY